MHRTALLAAFAVVVPLAAAQGSGPVTIKPAAPRVGEAVTVTYDPSALEAVLSADEADLEVAYAVLERPDPTAFVQPTYRPVPMERDGGLWRATVPYTDGALGIQLVVQSDTLADHNGHRHWSVAYHDDDGQPVRGARHAQAVAGVNAAIFAERMDLIQPGAAAFATAVEADPADVRSLAWSAMFTQQPSRDSVLSRLLAFEAGVDVAALITAGYDGDVVALRDAHDAYARLMSSDDVGRLESRLIELDPDGPEARDAALKAWRTEADPAAKRALFSDLISGFPGLAVRYPDAVPFDALLSADAGDPDALAETARRYLSEDPLDPAGAHATVALALAEAGDPDAALAYARRAVDLAADQWRTARFLGLQRPAERRALADATRGRAETALGQALYADGAMAAAEEAFERAVAYAPDDKDAWLRLAAFREATAGAESAREALQMAFAAYRRALVADPADAEVRDGFERAYVRSNGSADGFDRAYGEALREAFADERVDEPLEAFSLVDLDGNPVTSQDLAGDVVFLDIWATWCVPCIEGFPSIQRVYDRYADDPRVHVLTVHSDRNETADDARAFAESAPFTFPYLVDEDARFRETIASRGLPAKVILDARGRVQFRSAGTSYDAESMAALYGAQIDLLRFEAEEAGSQD